MKKLMYFTLMLLSMTLIGSVSAEEKVKPDNQNAVIESSAAQELPAATEQEAASAVDIAATIPPKSKLCEAQKDKCCAASPVNPDSKACQNFFNRCGETPCE